MMRHFRHYGVVALWVLVVVFALTAAVPVFADEDDDKPQRYRDAKMVVSLTKSAAGEYIEGELFEHHGRRFCTETG